MSMIFSSAQIVHIDDAHLAVIGPPTPHGPMEDLLARVPHERVTVSELLGPQAPTLNGAIFVVDPKSIDVRPCLDLLRRSHPAIPVLCVGLDVGPERGLQLLAGGADAFLTAPITGSDVVTACFFMGMKGLSFPSEPSNRIVPVTTQTHPVVDLTAADATTDDDASTSTCTGKHGGSVLLIDDDPVCGHAISGLIRAYGWAPTCVNTLHSAQEQLAARDFDLVLTDVNLPDGTSEALIDTLLERGKPAVACMSAGVLPQRLGLHGARKPLTYDAISQLLSQVEPVARVDRRASYVHDRR